jgi:hypothetical protein
MQAAITLERNAILDTLDKGMETLEETGRKVGRFFRRAFSRRRRQSGPPARYNGELAKALQEAMSLAVGRELRPMGATMTCERVY